MKTIIITVALLIGITSCKKEETKCTYKINDISRFDSGQINTNYHTYRFTKDELQKYITENTGYVPTTTYDGGWIYDAHQNSVEIDSIYDCY